jgi:hypothetical protein
MLGITGSVWDTELSWSSFYLLPILVVSAFGQNGPNALSRSFIDELAHAAGKILSNFVTELKNNMRARRVLEQWLKRRAGAKPFKGEGRGIASMHQLEPGRQVAKYR